VATLSDPALDPSYPVVARKAECTSLDEFFTKALVDEAGATKGLYVTGMPGTGKTKCVRAAARAWRAAYPKTVILEVNCMGLPQRTLAGVLASLEERSQEAVVGRWKSPGAAAAKSRTEAAIASCFLQRLAQAQAPVIIIADEVDQLVRKGGVHSGCSSKDSGAEALGALLTMPLLPGSPPLAVVTIANSVDLLERLPRGVRSESLLFEAYTVAQLREILRAEACDKGLQVSSQALELCVRRVANQSGDCRQALRFLEQWALEESEACAERDANQKAPVLEGGSDASVSAPGLVSAAPKRKLLQGGRVDPFSCLNVLPLEQQILLCALTGLEAECAAIANLMKRHKQLCEMLKQRADLSSKSQVSNALSALEQRGLIELRQSKSAKARRTMASAPQRDGYAELTVPCSVAREALCKANPLLERCWDA